MQWNYTQVEQNEFEQEYKKINDSFKDKLVYKIGDSAGFFSEFYCTIGAMAYCLANKIKFCLNDTKANFAPRNGFEEFFEPFYKTDRRSFVSKHNFRYWQGNWEEDENYKSIVLRTRLRKFLSGTKYFTQDVFQKIFYFYSSANATPSNYPIKVENDLVMFQFLTRMLWKLNKKTKEIENEILKKMDEKSGGSFTKGKFVAMQYRKGDKFELEKKLSPPIDEYFKYISKLSNSKDILLLCDDLDAYEYMKEKYSDYNFILSASLLKTAIIIMILIKLMMRLKRS